MPLLSGSLIRLALVSLSLICLAGVLLHRRPGRLTVDDDGDAAGRRSSYSFSSPFPSTSPDLHLVSSLPVNPSGMATSSRADSEGAELRRSDFPDGFVFGVATSAYQVEGARNVGGKGDSIWDAFCETKGKIRDGKNGDVAVDQFHRYKEDVELIANLGFRAYRFSISWSRIFPDGLGTKINEDGVSYYNNVINSLLDKGIQPYVTLYHWDLPLNLHVSAGGWLSNRVVEYFALYADACFSKFGDRVKNWITINEPLQTSLNGYGYGSFAPGRRENSSAEPFLAAHYQLLAHAAAVDVYKKKYKTVQNGIIGLVVDGEWAEAFSNKTEDKDAAQRRLDFHFGWYLDPIFFGDYPASMRQRLGDLLPKFSDNDKAMLKNSLDFVGLNHYTTRYIAHSNKPDWLHFYHIQDMERKVEHEDGSIIGDTAASEWLYIVPWGIRKLINYITKRYNNPPIYVTENGMDDEDSGTTTMNEFLNDEKRVRYFKGYMGAVAESIRDGADVRGYFAWSLLDNFEWAEGYTKRFGIVYVDFENDLARHPKSSARWFSRLLRDDAS